MLSSRAIGWLATGILTLATVLIGACSVEAPGSSSGDYLTEAEACRECQAILVECTSTSKNEQQFVGCRDQFLECQQARSLGLGKCANPNDADACTLCRGRLKECQGITGDNEGCGQQFSVCKAFLITRSDLAAECTETETASPQVACMVCQEDFVACASDASGNNTAELCSSKFGQCLIANALDAAICAPPSGAQACSMCVENHDACQAAAGPECDANFEACAAAIAAAENCQLAGAGSGGSGGSGAGGSTSSGEGGAGGGGATDNCAHDTCEEGDALEPLCNACATTVCQQDPYCCETAWDDLCVDLASQQCGCN